MYFNVEARGLGKVMRDREEQVLRLLWKGPATTGDIVEATGLRREEVLRILGEFHEQGIVTAREDYTMGAPRTVWSAVFTEAEFRRWIAHQVLSSLLDDWSEAEDAVIETVMKRANLRESIRDLLREADRGGP